MGGYASSNRETPGALGFMLVSPTSSAPAECMRSSSACADVDPRIHGFCAVRTEDNSRKAPARRMSGCRPDMGGRPSHIYDAVSAVEDLDADNERRGQGCQHIRG